MVHNNQDILVGTRIRDMYVIGDNQNGIGTNKNVTNMVTPVTDIKLIHARVGHLGYRQIVDMAKRGMLEGVGANMDHVTHAICDGCEFGKSRRVAISDHSNRIPAKEVLERTNCGLINPITIDDQSTIPIAKENMVIGGSDEDEQPVPKIADEISLPPINNEVKLMKHP